MEARPFLLVSLSFLFFITAVNSQMPGFVSIDCGGKENFTDDLGLDWIPDDQLIYGETVNISVANETRKQYMTLRHFPADDRKYCYTLNVMTRTRYLVRTTFLYGNFDNNNVYPKFDLSFGATYWSTIVISDANTVEIQELIFLASLPTISVCLSNATTGKPFISTLELRQFNDSVYYTDFENQFFLSTSARINFGTDSDAPVRYPDDPFDRIWESDSLKKANYLVDVAAGTKKISTIMPIDVNRDERPPEKVMQTAVVGTSGVLTYRLNLYGFPGFGWACTYFAEIEDLGSNETRKFRLILPGTPDITKAAVNIQENAQGKNRLYEPGLTNISLPFILSFQFQKTSDSSRGPLLNAMEINKYLRINGGSLDGMVVADLVSHYSAADWAQEGGDPCLPVPWSWVQCNSDPQPRIISILLSRKNLTGNIPSELTNLTGLSELWLDGNSLTGPIPDFTACVNLKIIHLENNQLTGELPSSLADLQDLKELYLQNNSLSGTVPSSLLKKNLLLNYYGNINLHKGGNRESHIKVIIGSSVGAAVLLIATIISYIFLHKGVKKHYKEEKLPPSLPAQSLVSSPSTSDVTTEAAHCFAFSEIEDATRKFEKKIGSGGFGVVYYGKMKDGKEIAVKVLASNSYQGKREFSNEVTLLSRIHHRNLVQFLGYCQEEGKSILVYEYMHHGTLKERLYGPLTRERSISWLRRLEIAEDAAKGIEYLHTGCVPTIIHRDLKSSNILLDKHMRAKVSDFGLSKFAVDGAAHVSSIVRGTVGYLDPDDLYTFYKSLLTPSILDASLYPPESFLGLDVLLSLDHVVGRGNLLLMFGFVDGLNCRYYVSQQLTDKSDVYSFGVILLELISGQEAISNESFGVNCRNIVQWAKTHIESGDIQGIIDPSLQNEFDIQSVWKIAEKAMMCVQSHGSMRPSISEVLKEIQDAILIERGAEVRREGNSDDMSRGSIHSSINIGSIDLGVAEPYISFDESLGHPTAR